MALFLHKVTGEIVERPAHYATHPTFGKKLELITSAEEVPAKKRAPKKPIFFTPAVEAEETVGVEITEEPNAPEEQTENNEE